MEAKVETLKKSFGKMGATLVVNPFERRRFASAPDENSFRIDVRNGSFIIFAGDKVDISVVDIDKHDRHMVINARMPVKTKNRIDFSNAKYLVGHDERDWFVAAIPESKSVKNVVEAKTALKPKEVLEAERGVGRNKRFARKNKARIRQGEWFFIPEPKLILPKGAIIHKNEPISRGGGSKPHMVDEIYRTGGRTVYVSTAYPNGVPEHQFKQIVQQEPVLRASFQLRTANAVVYARGCVRHKDHATINLDGWHRVLMNTESEAASRRNMLFLD